MQKNMLKSLICFIPSVLGLLIWNYLPDKLAIHFGMFGVDGYESKIVVIFIFPLLFFILNILYNFILIKQPNWLTPIYNSKYFNIYLFPILSLFVFLISISNSI